MEVKGFIARDRNGELYLYSDTPVLREDGTFVATTFVSDKNAFKDIKKEAYVKCTILYETKA